MPNENATDAFSLVDGDIIDRIRRLELHSRFRVEGLQNGNSKSPFKGFTADFLQHRQYFPGDNIKYLDWRVYGKADKLFIKEYEELTNARVSFLVDVSGSMGFVGDSHSKHDFTVRGVAMLMYLALIHKDSFALTTFNTTRVDHVPFSSGKGHLRKAFRSLLEAKAGGATDFIGGMQMAMKHINRKGLTVVVSDFMEDPLKIARVLSRLRYQGSDLIGIQVVDPSETQLDFTSMTRFHDMESDEVLVIDPALVKRDYAEMFAKHRADLKDAFQSHGMDFVSLDVQDEIDVPFMDYVRKRMELLS